MLDVVIPIAISELSSSEFNSAYGHYRQSVHAHTISFPSLSFSILSPHFFSSSCPLLRLHDPHGQAQCLIHLIICNSHASLLDD